MNRLFMNSVSKTEYNIKIKDEFIENLTFYQFE